MFKMIFAIFTILFFVVFFSCSSSAGPNMKEGLWEITVQMEMPGMPMKMPPQTTRVCLTKKDNVPQEKEKPQDCKMVKHNVKGDTVNWTMECIDRGSKIVSDGSITYKGDSMSGIINVKAPDMQITQKMSGKWVGNCPK